ncbi:hypothetical protein CYMTET_10849 [Cymbomonas tetramitiformis]|uniref:Uncharacterized protein n=1 Tax=Cymbomonas tetramitiformis TaxID=36881 RepID=A0AAE0GNI1_9CHLO|nr:hypothetical protein CYMTET_10849 [Cymbomonas tetramitiformis]
MLMASEHFRHGPSVSHKQPRDLEEMPQREWCPLRCKASSHINYLELFVVWRALALWAHRLSGWTMVVRIDNQCAIAHVDKFGGPVEYLPPLHKIFHLCAEHNIRLRPKYITSEDNELADLLSRLRLEEFHMRWAMRRREVLWRHDRDDWMFNPVLFRELDEDFGSFELYACVAESRANAFCSRSRKLFGLQALTADGHGCVLLGAGVGWRRGLRVGVGAARSVPAEELLEELAVAVERYQDAMYAEHTLRSYHTGIQAFVTFCVRFACLGCLEPLLPASDVTLGVRRTWERLSKPVMPIMLQDLREMATVAELSTVSRAALWAAVLTGFYGYMLATADLPDEAPIFQSEKGGKRGGLVPMTHSVLVAAIKKLAAKIGRDPAKFAGHSLRLRLRVDKLYIKLQGDWKSDCYERYCELDDEQGLILPVAFAEAAEALT